VLRAQFLSNLANVIGREKARDAEEIVVNEERSDAKEEEKKVFP
jgi:hypothetical protein